MLVFPDQDLVNKASSVIHSAGFRWVEDRQKSPDHLANHAPQSLVFGSKFSEKTWENLDDILKCLTAHAQIGLAEKIISKSKLETEIILPYKDAGTRGTLCLSELSDINIHARLALVRDPNAKQKQTVNVAVIDREARPLAHSIFCAAGQYGRSKTLGMYTVFPGDISCPLPSQSMKRLDPARFQESEKYWSDRVFLATPEEVINTLKKCLPKQTGEFGLSMESLARVLSVREQIESMEKLSRGLASRTTSEKQY